MNPKIQQLVLAQLTKQLNRAPTAQEIANMQNDSHAIIAVLVTIVGNLASRLATVETKVGVVPQVVI